MSKIGELRREATRSQSHRGLRVLCAPLNSFADEVREAMMLLSIAQGMEAAVFMSCDESMPACSNVTVDREAHGRPCNSCHERAADHLERIAGYDCLYPRKLLTAKDRQRAHFAAKQLRASPKPSQFMFEQLPLGSTTIDSIGRYLMVGGLEVFHRLESGDQKLLDMLERFSEGIVLFYLYSLKAVEVFSPDLIISSHLFGTSWTGIRYASLKLEVPLYTFASGRIRNTLQTNLNTPVPDSRDRLFSEKVRTPLTPVENAWLDAYLESRQTLSREYQQYDLTKQRGQSHIKERLSIPKGTKVISIFPSTPHEQRMVHMSGSYSDQQDWIEQTLAFLGNRENTAVIIKPHPGESRGIERSVRKVADLLKTKQADGVLPKNVYPVYPEDGILASDLYDVSDLAIGYTTTVMLEIACIGKPVLLVGQNSYRGKGFTRDVETASEYETALNEFLDGNLTHYPISPERARVFMLQLIWSISSPFEAVDFSGWTATNISVRSVRDLLPGGLAGMRGVARSILSKTPVENTTPMVAAPWEMGTRIKEDHNRQLISQKEAVCIRPNGELDLFQKGRIRKSNLLPNAFDAEPEQWAQLLSGIELVMLTSSICTVDVKLVADGRRELPPEACLAPIKKYASAATLIIEGDAWITHPDADDYLEPLLQCWTGRLIFVATADFACNWRHLDSFDLFIARVEMDHNGIVLGQCCKHRDANGLSTMIHRIAPSDEKAGLSTA